VGPPKRYLGANIAKFQLPDGTEAWSTSACDYVKTAVRHMEEVLSLDPIPSKLCNRIDRPLPLSYRPEVDVSPALSQEMTTCFQTGLGILWWIVELGRLDILTEVSMLAAHNALPREGHLEAMYHIFSYLKGHRTQESSLTWPILPSMTGNFRPSIGQTFIQMHATNCHLVCQNHGDSWSKYHVS